MAEHPRHRLGWMLRWLRLQTYKSRAEVSLKATGRGCVLVEFGGVCVRLVPHFRFESFAFRRTVFVLNKLAKLGVSVLILLLLISLG